jgi:hypothetical protein
MLAKRRERFVSCERSERFVSQGQNKHVVVRATRAFSHRGGIASETEGKTEGHTEGKTEGMAGQDIVQSRAEHGSAGPRGQDMAGQGKTEGKAEGMTEGKG